MVDTILRGLFDPALRWASLNRASPVLAWASPASARLGLGRNAWRILASTIGTRCVSHQRALIQDATKGGD